MAFDGKLQLGFEPDIFGLSFGRARTFFDPVESRTTRDRARAAVDARGVFFSGHYRGACRSVEYGSRPPAMVGLAQAMRRAGCTVLASDIDTGDFLIVRRPQSSPRSSPIRRLTGWTHLSGGVFRFSMLVWRNRWRCCCGGIT